MKGQYIEDRKMERMIAAICQQNGISHRAVSDGWVHLLEHQGKRAEICGYIFGMNNAGAVAVANDKVATSEVLAVKHIPHVAHALLRKSGDGKMRQYGEAIVGEIVVKPAQGTSGGYGVRRCADSAAAEQWLKDTHEPAWAVSPFFDIDHEVRYCMCDGELLLAYKKLPVMLDNLKMFNLGLGATPAAYLPRAEEIELARSAMDALHLRSGMVDIVMTAGGEMLVLEVNAGCMLENYARVSSTHEQQAYKVYERLISALFTKEKD